MPLPDDLQVNLVNTIDEAFAMKRWLGERREGSVIGLDTETSGLDPYAPDAKLRLVQIGDGKNGWAVPWEQWGGAAMECLNAWDGSIALHNSSFDARWLQIHAGWDVPWHRLHDTMIMAQIDRPGKPAGLKPLSRQLIDPRATVGDEMLKEAMAKEGWTWANIPVDYEAYWAYGALDPVLTVHLYNHFRTDKKYPRVYDLEMATRRVMSKMEDNGSRVDLRYCEVQRQRLEEYVDRSKAWAQENWGVSITSSAQLIKFFTKIGAEITRFTKSDAPSVDKEQLKLFANGDHELAAQAAKFIIKVRKADKLAGTYFSNFIDKHDEGILHPSIRTLGARTGRMSIQNPALQTLPKGEALVRDAFIPRNPDEVIISSDYSQIEMRLMAHFSKDEALCQAFREADATGGDFFVNLGRDIYADPNFSKEDKRRGLVKNCVPLSTQILTKRGWLSYDQVVVGDETLGYDFKSKSNHWTKITGVHLSPDAKVFRIGKKNRGLYGTYDHRWIADNGRSGNRGIVPRFIHAYEFAGTENRIILSAPAEDGRSSITDQEASILGWVLGDGSIKRGIADGSTAQGRYGQRIKCFMQISQSKPSMIKHLDSLLSDIPHRRYTSKHQTLWVIDPSWSRNLLDRAQIIGKHDFDAWMLAMSLSGTARRSMASALELADGKRPGSGRYEVVQESGTPVSELVVALGYLLGRSPSRHIVMPNGKGWQKKPIDIISHLSPTMTGQRSSIEFIDVMDTWCVSTELSSWTARQEDGQVLVTGNTLYGAAYGAGVAKMAESAGVPFDQMKAVSDAVFSTYPGIKKFMKDIENQGMQRERTEGQGYVITPFGRRLPCDEGRVYSLTNYSLQGHAAELLKDAVVRLDAAGYGDYMMLPIHDEVVFSIPASESKDAMREIQEIMSFNEGYAVPLTAEPEGPLERWGEKYRKEVFDRSYEGDTIS